VVYPIDGVLHDSGAVRGLLADYVVEDLVSEVLARTRTTDPKGLDCKFRDVKGVSHQKYSLVPPLPVSWHRPVVAEVDPRGKHFGPEDV